MLNTISSWCLKFISPPHEIPPDTSIFGVVPDPVLRLVFLYVSATPKDTLVVTEVCKRWRAVIMKDSRDPGFYGWTEIWKYLMRERWPGCNTKMKIKDWCRFYKQRVNALKKSVDPFNDEPIENCNWEFKCPLVESNLLKSTAVDKFHCDKCRKTVHTVYTQSQLRHYAEQKKCVLFKPAKSFTELKRPVQGYGEMRLTSLNGPNGQSPAEFQNWFLEKNGNTFRPLYVQSLELKAGVDRWSKEFKKQNKEVVIGCDMNCESTYHVLSCMCETIMDKDNPWIPSLIMAYYSDPHSTNPIVSFETIKDFGQKYGIPAIMYGRNKEDQDDEYNIELFLLQSAIFRGCNLPTKRRHGGCVLV